MAISSFCKTNLIIGIDDFIDYVDSEININDDNSVISASTMLQALANNKAMLIEIFNQDLLSYDIKAGASYSQSSSIIGIGKRKSFVVRANMWPSASTVNKATIESNLFSYDLPHNHNFSFLTANYFGPGYETHIWEFLDPKAICGKIGEKVEIEFLERTRLEPGKQMFFRRQRDIHIQLPPEEFSVSLNLLIMLEQDNVEDQFEFDLHNNQITGFPSGTLCSKRSFFMEIAGKIGNQDTADILLRIAAEHPCQRTRGAALASAFNILPDLGKTLKGKIKDDRSPFIKEVLKLRI